MNANMTKRYDIKRIIGRSFIIANVFVLFIVLCCSFFINRRDLQVVRENNLKRTHEILSHLLVPAAAIADVTELKRILSLSSDENVIFAIVDNNSDIILSDYANLGLVKSILVRQANQKPVCGDIKSKSIEYANNSMWVSCSELSSISFGVKKQWGLLIGFSKYPMLVFTETVLYVFSITLICLLFISIWFRNILQKKLLRPLTLLGQKIAKVSESPHNSDIILDGFDQSLFEVQTIKIAFDEVLSSLKREYKQRVELSERKAIAFDIVAHVAHDIRSPLTVMEVNLEVLENNMPASELWHFKKSIQSIRDIANNLLTRYRTIETNTIQHDDLSHDVNNGNSERYILLFSQLEFILAQKRYEWQNNPCLIELDIEPQAKMKWLFLAPSEMQRMLSNLLNNAYESLRDNRKINVFIGNDNGGLKLCIRDTGVGIPIDKLTAVLSGETLKQHGNGLGLSSAQKYLSTLGGHLTLNSTVNLGTEVMVYIPVKNVPLWFCSKIECRSDNQFVVIDDDVSIHSLWKQRLQQVGLASHHFSKSEKFFAWYHKQKDKDKYIYLVDFELHEKQINGLQILQALDPEKRGYLITSHAESIVLQQKAIEHGFWLIPKSLIGEVTLNVNEQNGINKQSAKDMKIQP